MQKLIFIVIASLILGLIIYIGVSAILRGKKLKQANKNKSKKN